MLRFVFASRRGSPVGLDRIKLAIISNPDKFTAAAPYTFLVASLLVLIFGPGRLSLDTLLAARVGAMGGSLGTRTSDRQVAAQSLTRVWQIDRRTLPAASLNQNATNARPLFRIICRGYKGRCGADRKAHRKTAGRHSTHCF